VGAAYAFGIRRTRGGYRVAIRRRPSAISLALNTPRAIFSRPAAELSSPNRLRRALGGLGCLLDYGELNASIPLMHRRIIAQM